MTTSASREPIGGVEEGLAGVPREGGSEALTAPYSSPPHAPTAADGDAPPQPRVSFSGVFRYADRKDVILMIIGGVAAFFAGSSLPVLSLVFGIMVQTLTEGGSDVEQLLSRLASVMVYVGVALFIISFFQVFCWMLASKRQITRIQLKFFEAVMRQDMAWHDEHKVGELTAQMDGDLRVVHNGINDKFSAGIFQFGMFIFGFGLGFYQSWQLTLVMLGAFPFIAGVGAVMARVMTRMTEATREHYSKAGEIATEVLENIKTVQIFGQEAHEVERYTAAAEPCYTIGIKREFASCLAIGATYFVLFATYGLAFWFSSYLIEWGNNNVGDVTGTFFSVLNGSFAIGMIFPSISAFGEARGAAHRVYGTIDRVPFIDIATIPPSSRRSSLPATDDDTLTSPNATATTTTTTPTIQHSIEFKDVSFSYPTRPDSILFQNLNLTIKKGSSVAFSGASGCGKSSLIQLIQRFYDPTSGNILIDGVCMKSIGLRSWRDQIGIVSQEPSLFSGTIAENVRVGKPDATLDEVQAACKDANIHSLVMQLPQQYDTSVGSVGSQLSGGQKQRLAIARAIIKRPSLLILDEATSALDRKSEMEVQAALDRIISHMNLTVVVIAHRLATIRNVDTIHFIVTSTTTATTTTNNDGECGDVVVGSKIVESGSYEQLMSLGGEFAAMAHRQGIVATNNTTTTAPDADLVTTTNIATTTSLNNNNHHHHHIIATHQYQATDDVSDVAVVVPLKLDDADNNDGGEVKDESVGILSDEEASSTSVPHLRIIKMLAQDWWAVLPALLGSLMVGGVYPAFAVVIANMMDVLGRYADSPQTLRSEAPFWAALFLAVSGTALIGWLLQSLYAVAGERVTRTLRRDVFGAILSQDAAFFDTPGRDAGAMSSVLSGDCEAVHQLWGPSVGFKVQMFCNIIAGLAIAFSVQWKLALVTSAGIPAVALCASLHQLLVVGHGHNTKGNSSVDTIKIETLSNIRTVTSFNMQKQQLAKYEAFCVSEAPAAFRNAIIMGIAFSFSQFSFFGMFALSFWYGGKLIGDGEATFLQVMTASMAVLMGAVGAGESGGFASKLKDAEIGAKRVFFLLDRQPSIGPSSSVSQCTVFGPSPTTTTTTTGSPPTVPSSPQPSNDGAEAYCQIEVKDVHFCYPARPECQVLLGLTTIFASSSVNGLMGQTGCGKSTIIQLLSRFYNYQGTILINGVDLSTLDIAAWRKKVSIVLQEPSLFSGSVFENIRYSRPEATNEDVYEVARLAAIHDDILLMPNGYDTDVGYRGRALSGGQKQRVAIARGLLRRPHLLLLDEATSALDNATESRVQQGIDAAHKANPMTIISVAHRLTTIRHADKIVLMEGGCIIEEGSHDELMGVPDGQYKERWETYQQATNNDQQTKR